MATVMGMDLKSAVQTVGKALDDPIKGLDSLRRQGFAFTEEQKEELKQLVENGEQLKAQKIILDELNTTYGGSAKSAQSSFDKQRDAVISFKETLGNQLIPVLDVFAEKSATSFSTLTEKIKTIDFSEIAGTVEYSVQVITEYFGVFYNNAKELVKGLTERFGDVEISLDTVKEAVYNSLNNIYKQMQISFGFVKALIDGDWKLAWEYAKIYVLNVCKKILDGLDDLLNKMPDLVNGAIKGLNAYYEAQDKVLIEWLHLPEKWFKAPRLGTYDGKNFIDTSELQKQIDEATSIIEKATGKQVTVNLTGLEKIDENKKKYQKKAEAGEIQLTKTITVEEKKRVKESETIFSSFLDNLKKQVADKTEFYNGIFSKVTETFSTMFSMLGENLAGAGHSFEDFASVALNALSEVLKSISAQLSAIAVLKVVSKDYADATIALAGATASMVASGVASQVSKNLTTTKKKIDAVGDSANKAGKDLEYFINRLKDIQSGFTYSSKNLVQTVKDLKTVWEEAQEAESEKYKELRSAWDKLNDTHFYMDYKRVQDLTAEYENLSAETKKLKDEYYSYTKTVIAGESQIIKENAEEVRSYKDIYNSVYRVRELQKEYQKSINSKMATDFIKEQIDFQSQYTKVLILEQMESIQKGVISLYESLSSVGKNIGEKITSSIINGMDKSSFLQDMKAYFRENIIKFAVYTDEFQTRLAQIGARVGALFSGGFANTFATIDSVLIKDELEAMYDETAETVKGIDKLLDSIFGKTTETIEKELSAFTQLINSFEEQLKDVGGEIGTQFVDAISNGMNQSDFLGKMKDWIKRMLVQSVVYTESMKAEIEAIGQAITKGIREGFTETSLHEIRRDLSWVFNEANETVANLDNILDRTFGGYAIGTNNALSGLHLVGEAGPELVRFRGGEQVLNANNTQKALEGIGGTTINQNVTFNNLQDTSAYAMMNQFKQYNRQMAINGVI
jgi:hypothetical protein